MKDDFIPVPRRTLFTGPIFPIEIENSPLRPGLRYNGFRWVADDSLDTERAVIPQEVGPGNDMFGGSGRRTPPRPAPKKPKSRRRGPGAE